MKEKGIAAWIGSVCLHYRHFNYSVCVFLRRACPSVPIRLSTLKKKNRIIFLAHVLAFTILLQAIFQVSTIVFPSTLLYYLYLSSSAFSLIWSRFEFSSRCPPRSIYLTVSWVNFSSSVRRKTTNRSRLCPDLIGSFHGFEQPNCTRHVHYRVYTRCRICNRNRIKKLGFYLFEYAMHYIFDLLLIHHSAFHDLPHIFFWLLCYMVLNSLIKTGTRRRI